MLALVSKNAGCSWAWPVTLAPASSSALVIPLIVEPSAPGAVTSTTFCPLSRLVSSSGADVWANSPSLAIWFCCSLILARCESIWRCSILDARSSGLDVPLQRGRADDDADRQREEHGDDRNQVVPKVDH